ncbi:50S ribosomal protein L23 [Candidatus Saccharibacteria bacterium]|nr:50S ribosomal protein L23 [Candidatus Saccharibacteria bacterium]
MNQVIVRPVISEKSMALAATGKYLFDVPTSANKVVIAQAVAAAFKVEVTEVNTSIIKGKVKKFAGRKGQRKDRKRAYVSLKKGQKISAFDAESEKK